jgi:hypothetical protein
MAWPWEGGCLVRWLLDTWCIFLLNLRPIFIRFQPRSIRHTCALKRVDAIVHVVDVVPVGHTSFFIVLCLTHIEILVSSNFNVFRIEIARVSVAITDPARAALIQIITSRTYLIVIGIDLRWWHVSVTSAAWSSAFVIRQWSSISWWSRPAREDFFSLLMMPWRLSCPLSRRCVHRDSSKHKVCCGFDWSEASRRYLLISTEITSTLQLRHVSS